MKRWFMAMGLLMFLGVSLFAQRSAGFDDVFEKANAHVKAHEFRQAINMYNNIIISDPDNVKAHLGRAYCRNELDIIDEAQKDVFKVLSIDNKNAEAYYIRGLIKVNQGKLDAALSDFNTAIENNADFKPAHSALINTYYLKEDFREALSICDKYIKKNPEFGDYYFYRGKLYTARGRYEKALEQFEKATELNTEVDPFELYMHRGDAKTNLEMYMEAKGDFDKAITLNKRNPSAYHGRGVVNYRLANYDAALKDFGKSIDLVNDYPEKWNKNHETYYNRGMTYFRMGEFEKACKDFHFSCQMGNSNSCKMVVLRCSR